MGSLQHRVEFCEKLVEVLGLPREKTLDPENVRSLVRQMPQLRFISTFSTSDMSHTCQPVCGAPSMYCTCNSEGRESRMDPHRTVLYRASGLAEGIQLLGNRAKDKRRRLTRMVVESYNEQYPELLVDPVTPSLDTGEPRHLNEAELEEHLRSSQNTQHNDTITTQDVREHISQALGGTQDQRVSDDNLRSAYSTVEQREQKLFPDWEDSQQDDGSSDDDDYAPRHSTRRGTKRGHPTK